MTSIRLEAVTKLFGTGASAVTAVDGVTLRIDAGELYFLLGPSGCGKTTLLRIIAGLTAPEAGRVFFDERDVTNLPVERRGTAMVFQNYALWPHMTVSQNVQFGPRMQGASRARRSEVAKRQLERVRMAGYGRRKPNQLSGGQQQRVALARALAAGAEALLLDEPLSNLDARLRLAMRSELRQLVKETGTTGVYVTHDQSEAMSMADRIAVMNEGTIAQIGTAEQLYNHPATRFVADFLGEANFIDGKGLEAPGTIETPVGPIVASHAPGAAGSSVTCCVRPERISILAAEDQGPGRANIVPARIAARTYLGSASQYACRLSDGTIWKVTLLGGAGANLVADMEVRLAFRPDDVAVLSD